MSTLTCVVKAMSVASPSPAPLHLQLQFNLPLHVVTQAALASAPDPALAAAFYISFIVFYAAAKSTRNRLKNSRATIREMRISCGFYVAASPPLPSPCLFPLHIPSLPAPGAGEVKIFIFYFIKCRRRRWAKFLGSFKRFST